MRAGGSGEALIYQQEERQVWTLQLAWPWWALRNKEYCCTVTWMNSNGRLDASAWMRSGQKCFRPQTTYVWKSKLSDPGCNLSFAAKFHYLQTFNWEASGPLSTFTLGREIKAALIPRWPSPKLCIKLCWAFFLAMPRHGYNGKLYSFSPGQYRENLSACVWLKINQLDFCTLDSNLKPEKFPIFKMDIVLGIIPGSGPLNEPIICGCSTSTGHPKYA